MRIESSITSVSWIPSEMVRGVAELPFTVGVAHYDVAPPDRLDGGSIMDALQGLRAADRFRIAHRLAGWIDVDGDEIVDFGQHGGGVYGSTTVRLGRTWSVPAARFSELRPAAVVGDGWVRFRQSVGGRTGVPAPRHVDRPPYLQITAPSAWTTLELTIHADGGSEGTLVGASPFPRHWIYDESGQLVGKSGLVDFDRWYRHAFGGHDPWSGEDVAPVIAEATSSLERELADEVMTDELPHGAARPELRRVGAGCRLMEQGEPGGDVALLLDGVAAVIVDGEVVAEAGPGAVVGERALLEAGRRTATIETVTECLVAVLDGARLEATRLDALRLGHRSECG